MEAIYALTGDDMRLIFTHQPADPVFDGLTLLCIVVFVLEIVLCMFAKDTDLKDDYFLSFFFVLDLISTVTLVIDLTWVNDSLQGSEEIVHGVVDEFHGAANKNNGRIDPDMPPLEDRVFLVTGATKGHGSSLRVEGCGAPDHPMAMAPQGLETAARLLDAGCTVGAQGAPAVDRRCGLVVRYRSA
eukprot:Skav202205  [mRNA]  locus=scaffold2207:104654:127765:- [translate_table: standard]